MVLSEELDIGGGREEIQANCVRYRMISWNLFLGRFIANSNDGFQAVSSSSLKGMICDIVEH